MEAFAPGDGERWRDFLGLWTRVGDALLESLLSPFPPVRGIAKLVRSLGSADALLDFARLGVLPVRRLAEEEFAGAGAARLLAGNALHADFAPESPGSGVYGLVMCGLAQQVGFPVPEGGARRLTEALVRRLEARGGRVRCGERVAQVVVADGRARAVRTAEGREVRAARAVLADVGAPQLYRDLLAGVPLPPRLDAALRRFQYDQGTVRVAWALREPVPWLAEPVRRAGTVHIAEGVDALTQTMAEIARGLVPAHPFLVAGQYALADPTRQPEGCETFWGYAHVPRERPRRRRRRGHRRRPGRSATASASRTAWSARSRPSRPASATASSTATSPRRRSSRRWTPTSWAARSTAAPPSCTSSSSSARCPASAARTRPCRASTSPPPPRIPAAACTAPAGRTRRGRRCASAGRRAGRPPR